MDRSEDGPTRRRRDVESAAMPETPSTTLRLDAALKADAQRCADERGIKLAEFIRQATVHYIAWCEAAKKAQDKS